MSLPEKEKLQYDGSMNNKTGIFIGRFQPLHEGHKQCIQKILKTHDQCVVLIRDTKKSDKNPYSLEERIDMIRQAFPDENKVICQAIPDPGADLTVHIGREVGYNLIQLDETTEAISATDIRAKLYAEKQAG